MKKLLFIEIAQALEENEQVEVTIFPPVRHSLFNNVLRGEFIKKEGLFILLRLKNKPKPLLVNYLRIVKIEKIDKP